MDAHAAYRVMLAATRTTYELQSRGAPDSRVLRLDGITAAIVPATPDRSVLNSVVVEDFSKLEAALGELSGAYADAGVRAWTVWVPDTQPDAIRRLLAGAGHALDGEPAAMLLDLRELREPFAGEPEEWSGEWDVEAAGKVNDAAFGDAPGVYAAAMGAAPPDTGHMYLARLDGRPASFVLVHDHEDTCEFWLAGTIPEARGRGLVSGLLHRALVDARERGCTTSTTQASRMGEPVYERLGYRGFGRIEMWERRVSRPPAQRRPASFR